jgi:hypothetical protein
VIGTNLTVILSLHESLQPSNVSQIGSRTQPPTPINPTISQTMDKVKNAKDPWLLFLYATSWVLGRTLDLTIDP